RATKSTPARPRAPAPALSSGSRCSWMSSGAEATTAVRAPIRSAGNMLVPRPLQLAGIARLGDLTSPGDGQGLGLDVLGDGRTASDISSAADPHGGYGLAIATDERAVLDHGPVFALTVDHPSVEVAGDEAAAHVHLGADLGVPEVRKVRHAGLLADRGFFE